MAEAAAFLFRVEPRDRVVRLAHDHVLHGEVEVFPEERIALPRYRVMQAVVPARLQYGRIEPGERDDSVAAVESGRISDLGAEQRRQRIAYAVDRGDEGEMGKPFGKVEQSTGYFVQGPHVTDHVIEGGDQRIDLAAVGRAAAYGVLRVGGELRRYRRFGYRARPDLGPLESAYDRSLLRLGEPFRMPVSAHGPHRVSAEGIAGLIEQRPDGIEAFPVLVLRRDEPVDDRRPPSGERIELGIQG